MWEGIWGAPPGPRKAFAAIRTIREDSRFEAGGLEQNANERESGESSRMMAEILYKDEAYKIIGCCMQVHGILGAGFLEEVYQEALEKEFVAADIPYERETKLTIMYRGQPLEKKYFADFVCFGKIIVELKAVAALSDAHCAQVTNYLKATGFQLGLLVNFGNPQQLQYVRRVNTTHQGMIQNANERESSESSRNASGGPGETPSSRDPFAEIRFIREDSRFEAGGAHD